MFAVHTPIRKPTPAARVVDTRPTVLITEQEVQLLTAAALTPVAPPRPSLLARWISRAKSMHLSAPAADDRDQPRYAQRHYGYIESAAMSRAMERL